MIEYSSTKKVKILLTFDTNFVPHAATVIESIIQNCPEKLDFVVIYYDISEEAQNTLMEHLKDRVNSFTFIKADFTELLGNQGMELMRICKTVNPRISPNTILRLFASQLLPQEEYIIYLDSDIIVLDNILKIFEAADLSMPVCAVTNYNPNYKIERKLDNLAKVEKVMWPYSTPWLIEADIYVYYRLLNIPFNMPVFNAGVLIMNLAYMRQHGTLNDALNFLLQNPEKCSCLDQDALNYAVKGHYFALKPKWNDATIKHYGVMSNYSIDDLKDAYNCPSIVHFVGGSKPWTYGCVSPYKKIYWKYRKQTPWNRKEYKDKNLRKIILHFFRFTFGVRFTDGFIFNLIKKISK